MKVSIVTACFNAAATVEETLRSVLDQSGVDLEYLVIDGASTDGTAAIIERFAPRLAHFVSEPDRGQVDALNKGFARATGDVLGFLNADDVLLPGTLAAVCAAFAAAPERELVYGGLEWIDLAGQPLGPHHGEIETLDDILDIFRVWWAQKQWVQPEVFFRRALKDRVGAFDDRYHLAFDYDFWVRCFLAGARVSRLDQPLVHFRRHANQKSVDTARGDHEIRAILREHLAHPHVPPALRRRLSAQLSYDTFQSAAAATRGSFGWSLLRQPQWLSVPVVRQRLAAAFLVAGKSNPADGVAPPAFSPCSPVQKFRFPLSPHPPSFGAACFRDVAAFALHPPAKAAAIPEQIGRELESIEQWTPPLAASGSLVSVHVVTGERDWPAAAWALASWCCFTEADWPIVIHDDGTLTERAVGQLRASFPAARIIHRPEADAALEPLLMAYPFCESFRRDHASALRVLDLPHFAAGERFIALAPDVLFFRHPREIVDWVQGGELTGWLLADADAVSGVSLGDARDELGIQLRTRASDAIALLHRGSLDLDFLDTVLARTSLLRREAPVVATTLNVLGASRGPGGLLPATYEVASQTRPQDTIVARHYQPAGWRRYHEDARTLVRPHLFAKTD